jgi:hypothetical protein
LDLPAGLSPPDAEAVKEYVEFVNALVEEHDALLYVEQKCVFIPDCGGTSDAVLIYVDDGRFVLHIVDAKFGSWYVSPFKNSQLRIYALAAYERFGVLYDFDLVRMTIAQPACENFTTDEMEIEDLLEFGEYVKTRVEDIKSGDAEFNPEPETTCRWCPGKSICPGLAEYGKVSAREQFGIVDEEDEELEGVLQVSPEEWTWADKMEVAKLAMSWAESVVNTVKDMVLSDPSSVPEYKAVEGRRTRKWASDEVKEEVEAYLTKNGVEPGAVYVTKPETKTFVSPSQAEKLFKGRGSGALREGLGNWIDYDVGAPTVVPVGDSRPALDRAAQARREFEGTDDDE